MQTFLIVVAGVVVGVLVLLTLGWFWLKRKLAKFGASLAAMAGSGITPFRISLEPCPEGAPWEHPDGVRHATEGLEALGYRQVGDYTVPEMEDVCLRGFHHSDEHFYAALYEHPDVGLVGDVVCKLEDGTHWTTSTVPDTGMARPEWAPLARFDLDVSRNGAAAALHMRLLEEVGDGAVETARAEAFAEMFLDAYHAEMDWRIERGGPTAEEIRGAAAFGDMDEPDDDAIELVQSMWRAAIEGHFDEQVQTAFLERTRMSAAEWEEARDRLSLVHERSDTETKVEELAWYMAGLETLGTDPDGDELDRQHDDMRARIEPLFAGRTKREAFRAAQELLPEGQRFEHIGSVSVPVEADLYLHPDVPDDC